MTTTTISKHFNDNKILSSFRLRESSAPPTQAFGQNLYVKSCAVLTSSYSDRDVFGVYGISYPDKAGEIKTIITMAMVGLTEEHLTDDLLSPRRCPEQYATTVMCLIRREVLHIHKLNICLRDLEPENSFSPERAYRSCPADADRRRSSPKPSTR